MNDENATSRILLLDYIEPDLANKIIKAIVEINYQDAYYSKEMANYEPEPIQLIINSYGGSLYDGLGILGAMEASVTPIHTTCYGSAMSMSLYILAAGDHRRASRYATLMYHEPSTEVNDKMSSIEIELQEGKRLEALCDSILFEKTNLKKKEIADKKKKGDWFFTPEIAKQKGVIDEII